jgi:septal ring factor EnvC (AmiA/AmiB activator)
VIRPIEAMLEATESSLRALEAALPQASDRKEQIEQTIREMEAQRARLRHTLRSP